jgi:uncharacterized protein (TIGR02145 family)
MKTKLTLTIVALVLVLISFGQKTKVELTFTAVSDGTWVKLDSIRVMNITQGKDTILFWPDSVAVLDIQVGIHEVDNMKKSLQVLQNFPNPVTGQTTIMVYVPERDNVSVVITDVLGKQHNSIERMLDKGTHSFSFIPPDGEIFFFTANWKGTSHTIKILNNSSSAPVSALKYLGYEDAGMNLKTLKVASGSVLNSGDSLLFIGYANTIASVPGSDLIVDTPQGNKTYLFQIIEGMPCPGSLFVNYADQIYKTVQIGTQCWFKNNLNIGTRIDGVIEPTNNGILEKYCYMDLDSNCDIYGGLYKWSEMLQDTVLPEAQDICPMGWHIPTDDEWTILVNFLGGDLVAGGKMKSRGTIEQGTGLWNAPNEGATNESGFSAIPGGSRDYNGNFWHKGVYARFWSSTQDYNDLVWVRFPEFSTSVLNRSYATTFNGFSIRCTKD